MRANDTRTTKKRQEGGGREGGDLKQGIGDMRQGMGDMEKGPRTEHRIEGAV